MAIEARGSLYQDGLVQLTRASIIFRRYYFPWGRKEVKLADVEAMEIREEPSFVWRWKIQGSPDFRTWMPFDAKRPQRDRLYVFYMKQGWWRIGFSVERPEDFEAALKSFRLKVRRKPA